MQVPARLRMLSLRSKVAVTFVAVMAVALGTSTILSFRYWQKEFLVASQQQVVLAATSTRAAVESMLAAHRPDAARSSLVRVVSGAPVSAARVYGPGGAILVSADATEEGVRPGHLWIPDPSELPRDGVLKQTARGDTVRAYLPLLLDGQGQGVLEVELPVGSVKAVMERGALLGHGLMLVSFVALGIIVVTLLEREVVHPIRRIEHALSESPAGRESGSPDEVERLERSVHRLIEKERAAEERAAVQDRELAAKEGFAEVGELAAEMAHEFKRPLASIRTAMEVLQQEYEFGGAGSEMVGEVDHQLERLSDTMRDLFSLAKPVALDRASLPVEDVIDAALLEARGLHEKGIRVERRYDAGLPPILGDRHRLEQAFLNIVGNAAEAMPHGGTLTIRALARGDGHVEVVFEDTGTGIPAAEVERVLRPFYSTKPLGTGLGLPLVARIVRAHGGRLDLESREGKGTRVRIILPVAGRAPSTDPMESSHWRLSASSSSTTTT